MGNRVGQNWTIIVCAVLGLSVASLAAEPPTSRPSRRASTRIDLLYLHAKLLTSDAGLPDQARPLLNVVAKQKTWTESRTPVAVLTPEQAEMLVTAYTGVRGAAVVPATSTMLMPNRRVATSAKPVETALPADGLSFDVTATSAPLDSEGGVPLRFSAASAVTFPPFPPDRIKPFTGNWSAEVGVAMPVEQILLIDLGTAKTTGAITPGRPPRAFVLMQVSMQPVERKGAAAALQVAGDLYRSWDRLWPLINQVSSSIYGRQFAEGREQIALLRKQLRPILDAAEGTDYDRRAAAMAGDLDETATALRKFDLNKAFRSFKQFIDAGNKLHSDLRRLMADSSRLTAAPATRPVP